MAKILKEKYDVIVIGSGVGGGGCAALLAAAGYDTLMLEKNERLGGACSSYYKNGYTIDVAVHMFAGDNHFRKILKKTGHPDEIKFYTELGSRTTMRTRDSPPFAMSRDRETAGDMFRAYQEFLKTLGASDEDAEKIFEIFAETMKIRKKDCYELMNVPLSEWLNQFSTSPNVHGLFGYFCGIMFAIPHYMASTGEYLYTMTQGSGGLVYPYGGAIAIPNAFGRIVEKEGGTVVTNSRVKKILLDGNQTEGVLLQDDSIIKAPIVVSNAGMKPTILNLLSDKSLLEKDYIKQVENLIPSYSSITFKIALKKQLITEYDAVHLFYTKAGDVDADTLREVWESLDRGEVPKEAAFMSPIPSNMDPSLAPKGKQLMIMGGIAPPKLPKGKSWKPWIDRYWEMILEFYPEFEKHLDFLDVTTPLDIIKATGKPEAPVEGTALTVTQSGDQRISSKIPHIQGLYVAGDTAGTNIHGIGTQMALNSGINVFNLIQHDFPKAGGKEIKIRVK
ncbi:MAG: NAD(P)/FAD-dependent oxidoreductase [Candidatus Helarchaeota archaeon]|nr:NAD(P)/FAD-dependent oxidoreductase [Candidatus Helarchaeota archaeon]